MPKTAEVEALAEQVKNLTTANKLRLAAGLIEADRVDLAETIVQRASDDLAAWRLFRKALK